MNEPQNELMELAFYWPELPRLEAFARVVNYCLAHGGRFSGQILVTEEPGARSHRFTHLFERTVRVINITAAQLQQKLQDEDTDVVKVGIWSAIGVADSVPEIVTYNAVSPAASRVDKPSIAIVSEGWGYPTEFKPPGYERMARKKGRRSYEKFIDICNAFDPDYAANLGEEYLPCRFDLRRGEGERSFDNFYVSERAYQASTLAAIDALYHDAYRERLRGGLYVSTWWMFNPREVTLANEARRERSARVARLLGMENR